MHSVQQHVCMCGYIQFTISCSAVIIIVLCHVVVLYNNYGTFCLLLYMKWLRLSCVCTCTTYTISTQHQFTFTYTLRIHMHACKHMHRKLQPHYVSECTYELHIALYVYKCNGHAQHQIICLIRVLPLLDFITDLMQLLRS